MCYVYKYPWHRWLMVDSEQIRFQSMPGIITALSF